MIQLRKQDKKTSEKSPKTSGKCSLTIWQSASLSSSYQVHWDVSFGGTMAYQTSSQFAPLSNLVVSVLSYSRALLHLPGTFWQAMHSRLQAFIFWPSQCWRLPKESYCVFTKQVTIRLVFVWYKCQRVTWRKRHWPIRQSDRIWDTNPAESPVFPCYYAV